jgi:hypothetical protein
MVDVLVLLRSALTSLFRSRVRLEAEILVLRQQINVLGRTPKRFAFGIFDRSVFVGLWRFVPGSIDALSIVQAETVARWHRAGFRSFWRWKATRRGWRPRVPLKIRKLIPGISLANPLWGAPLSRQRSKRVHAGSSNICYRRCANTEGKSCEKDNGSRLTDD